MVWAMNQSVCRLCAEPVRHLFFITIRMPRFIGLGCVETTTLSACRRDTRARRASPRISYGLPLSVFF